MISPNLEPNITKIEIISREIPKSTYPEKDKQEHTENPDYVNNGINEITVIGMSGSVASIQKITGVSSIIKS